MSDLGTATGLLRASTVRESARWAATAHQAGLFRWLATSLSVAAAGTIAERVPQCECLRLNYAFQVLTWCSLCAAFPATGDPNTQPDINVCDPLFIRKIS